MRELLLKMAGGEQSPPRAKAGEIFSAWVGSCLAIACIALLERYATGNSGFPAPSAPFSLLPEGPPHYHQNCG